jgi:hypothetical protein
MTRFKIDPNDSGGYSPGGHYRMNEAIVDIENEESVKKWASNLGVTPKELKTAIQSYGVVVRDIRKGLLLEKNKAS